MRPSRKQRTTQFFATEDEFASLLDVLMDSGLEVFCKDVDDVRLVEADEVAGFNSAGGSAQSLYLRAQPTEHEAEVLPSVAKEPARFGCAILEVPGENSDSLVMGVLAAVNMWRSDEGALFDDTAFGAHRLAAKAISDLCRHPSTVRNIVDGAAERCEDVRLSDGAVAAARRGADLVQRGVRNLRFEPA